MFGERLAHAAHEELHSRLVNWYIDTTGVPPVKRDSRGIAVRDREPELRGPAQPGGPPD